MTSSSCATAHPKASRVRAPSLLLREMSSPCCPWRGWSILTPNGTACARRSPRPWPSVTGRKPSSGTRRSSQRLQAASSKSSAGAWRPRRSRFRSWSAASRSWMPELDAHLERAFYERPTVDVARNLLGQVLVSETPQGRTTGRIVETEAYLGADDPASHAARLRTGRVEVMWGEPGIAYVYRSYGIHAMLNVVTEPLGTTGAVLIRALEPMIGVDLLRVRRGLDGERLLCLGPGKLFQALAIGLDLHGTDLVTSGRLWIAPGESPSDVSTSGRIGISRGQQHP